MFFWDSSELNDEQTAAVLEPSSVFLIACPGSGKTRTLTYKIAYELSRRTDKRIIVAITYTHRAANEIQERIEDLGIDTSGLWIGTIHSFCLEWILKPYGIYNPAIAQGFNIIDRHERERLLERLCKPYKIKLWDCDYHISENGYILGCQDSRKHADIHLVLKEYFKELSSKKMIDFELILWHANNIIKIQNQIPTLLSQIFSYILVDEYQDTKNIQYTILASILRAGAGKTKTFIVGDPNQAIYGSLGGYAMPVADFRNSTGIPIREMELKANYRSSKKIINYFSNFNVHNTKIESSGVHSSFPSQITYSRNISHRNLHNELVRLIRQSLDAGYSPENICVLAPQWFLLASTTRNLVSMLPDQEFDGPGLVPFSNDLDNFWFKLSKIVLTESSPRLLIRRMRWANEVINNLGDFGVDTSQLTARQLLRECNSLSITESDGLCYLDQAFSNLFERLNISLDKFSDLENYKQAFFDSSSARIERLRKDGASYINDISFFKKVFREKSGITVSTIHGIKGAEFDVVIAFGLLEGMVPNFSDPDGDITSRKLLYVLSSRARKQLHLISEAGRKNRSGTYLPTRSLASCQFTYD